MLDKGDAMVHDSIKDYMRGDVYVETPTGDIPVWFANHAHTILRVSAESAPVLVYWDYPFDIIEWACECYGIDPEPCVFHDRDGNDYTWYDEEWR